MTECTKDDWCDTRETSVVYLSQTVYCIVHHLILHDLLTTLPTNEKGFGNVGVP